MSDLEKRLAQLSPAKRALLEKMILERGGQIASRIPGRPDDALPTLSGAEKRLWFVDQIAKDDPFYNMPLAAHLKGTLNRPAFEEAINQVVSRHDSLRTTYHLVDGEPIRRVHDSFSVDCSWIDLAESKDSPADLKRRMRVAGRVPFDLENGPLLRVTVYRLAEDHHVILLVMHHIVSDGWSMIVMLRELTLAYEALIASGSENGELQNGDFQFEPLVIQYADFAHWQDQRLSDSKIESQLSYWQDNLAGAPAVLDLPIDHPRPAIQDFMGASVEFELSAELTARVNDLASDFQTTPFVILMAAEAVLLSRSSRQKDLVLGTASAGRVHPEIEPLIGFFVNTLPIRIQLLSELSFGDLVQQIHTSTLQAHENAEIPFEKLVEEFAPSRDRSFSPIFQAALVMQNLPRDHKLAMDLKREPSLRVKPMLVDNGTAKYDLTFFLWEENAQLIGHVEYRSTLFEQTTIERMIDSFQVILDAATASPDCEVDRLPILSDKQHRQLIEDFNDTDEVYPGTQRLHELVEFQASIHSQKTAVVCQGREFTFDELMERSRIVARWLLQQGIRSESPVVICLPRSFELIAAILGVLKAGGSFVPVDPVYPKSRIDQIIDATSASICIDADWMEVHREMPEELVAYPDVQPADRAYIIFTSGSSGTPKGVEIEHRTIVNFIRAQIDRMKVSAEDRFLFGFSPAFDGALSEIFYSLSCGGTCVVVDSETMLDPQSLTQFLNQHRVTCSKFPPALMSMLNPGDLPNLKTVASAGDKMTGDLARGWLDDDRRVFNGYGPTEVSVGCSMMPLHQNWHREKPPIGPPMNNMKMYVLDEHRRPVPIGVTGEIYIGGVGVGRGYLNSPEQTAAVFVPDRFSSTREARMYRTGDLGRWLSDGVVEFVGRADDQVSLRGYRIEPGEIAATLETLDSVRQATVIQRNDNDTSQLVGYVVPQPNVVASDFSEASEADHVSQWRSLFEQTHKMAPPVLDPSFNVTGWISTYTGQPIPTNEMREWADGAVDRIRKIQPKRVLEIGCGTGLLLLKIAGQCESYVGSDLLESSLENIRADLKRNPSLQDKVSLHQAVADDFSHLRDERFDCIVLNSVVQYFPSLDYLERVLDRALGFLNPGGHLFLGDIRNLVLQKAMAESVERFRAETGLPDSELEHRIASRIEHEEELLIDPRWFDRLVEFHPRLYDSRVLQKAMQADNELSRYRYDVVLRVDDPIADPLLDDLKVGTYGSQLAVQRAGVTVTAEAKPGRYTNDPVTAEIHRLFIQHLRDELTERLPSYMVPSAFVVLDELPRTINGKIDQDALPRPTGRPAWAGEFQAASTPTQATLVEIWEDLLDARPIGIHDDFFELGGHSMLAVRMTSDVEKRLGQRLPLVALFQNATIGHLANLIDQPELASINSTLVPLSIPTAGEAIKLPLEAIKPPLFCVHPAGGTVFCYMDLAKQIGGNRPVYGLQANGIDGNQPPHETLAEMAAHYARVIREKVPEGPVHLAGWSLGGNIAFEVARQLRKRGTDVGVLALLDSGLMSPDTELREEDFVPLLSALFPNAMNLDLEEIRQKPQDEQLKFFVERAAQAGIVPEELDAENLAANNALHVFGVFQANVKAVHEYVAESFDGEVHLFRPQDQGKSNNLFDDPVLGWREVTTGVQTHEVPGDHAHMLQEPAATSLAEKLSEQMEMSDQPGKS